MSPRRVTLTDRYGADLDGADLEHVAALWDELDDTDPEHPSVSLLDSDSWSLDLRIDRVLFENVDVGGEKVGVLPIAGRQEVLALAAEFIAGDLDALRARPWRGEAGDPEPPPTGTGTFRPSATAWWRP